MNDQPSRSLDVLVGREGAWASSVKLHPLALHYLRTAHDAGAQDPGITRVIDVRANPRSFEARQNAADPAQVVRAGRLADRAVLLSRPCVRRGQVGRQEQLERAR